MGQISILLTEMFPNQGHGSRLGSQPSGWPLGCTFSCTDSVLTWLAEVLASSSTDAVIPAHGSSVPPQELWNEVDVLLHLAFKAIPVSFPPPISLVMWWLCALSFGRMVCCHPLAPGMPFTSPSGSLCQGWLLLPCQPFDIVASSLAQIRCFFPETRASPGPILCSCSWDLCLSVRCVLTGLLKGGDSVLFTSVTLAPSPRPGIERMPSKHGLCRIDEWQRVEKKQRTHCLHFHLPQEIFA